MTGSRNDKRRRHRNAFKSQVIAQCAQPGVSIAQVARVAALIRIDAVWLAVEALDMRAGTDTALARVVKVFGEARAHHAYLFTNRRTNRIKVLVHDGYRLWLCARRLHRGSFVWASPQA